MLEYSGVQCVAQEPFVMHHSVLDRDIENERSPDFSSVFSAVGEQTTLQENKDTTHFNKRKCLAIPESPPKRHKHVDQQ